MKLGVMLGYWMPDPWDPTDLVCEAERLGYDSAWTAEAYGSDVFSPLCWSARAPPASSSARPSCRSRRAPRLRRHDGGDDRSSLGGRLLLGIGVSGPQVVEGWYGQPFPSRWAGRASSSAAADELRREGPVTFDGEHYTLPFPGGTPPRKPLKLIIRPLRTEIPIYLGARVRRTSPWRPRSPTAGCRSSTRRFRTDVYRESLRNLRPASTSRAR